MKNQTYRVLMCHERKGCCHVVAYECATSHTYVCACVHASVVSEIKHSFQSLRYLINYLLLIYPSDFLNYVMWDYLFVLICSSDVALRGASDLCVKRMPSIFT